MAVRNAGTSPQLLIGRFHDAARALAEVAPQVLEQRQEGDRSPMRDGARLEDGKAARPTALRQLVAEAALADAGLRDQTHHLAMAFERPREGTVEHRHLVVAPDESREPARPRDIETRASRAGALELMDVQRLAHALHRELAEVAQAEVPLDQARGMRAQVDRPRVGELLHSLR